MAKRGRRSSGKEARLAAPVTVRFTEAMYDAVCAAAKQGRVTIPGLLRRAVKREILNFGFHKLEDPPS